MIRKLLLVLIPLCLLGLSCCFFAESWGVLDDYDVVTKPVDQSHLVGTWVLKESSKAHLKKLGYPETATELQIGPAGLFNYYGFPNEASFDEETELPRKFSNESGAWRIRSDINNEYQLELIYLLSDFFKEGLHTSMQLMTKDDELLLVSFLGLPDYARLMVFYRKD